MQGAAGCVVSSDDEGGDENYFIGDTEKRPLETTKEDKERAIQLHYPDMPPGQLVTRFKEEKDWLDSKYVFPASQVQNEIALPGMRMVAINEHYAIAFEGTAPKNSEEWMPGEREMYRQRIAVTTTRVQVDTMMRELASKMRTGLYSVDFCKELREKLSELRDTLPELSTLEEQAGTEEAVLRHEQKLNEAMETVKRERPAARVINISEALRNKSKKKREPFKPDAMQREIKLRFTKHSGQKESIWKEPWYIPCFGGDAVTYLCGNLVMVADQEFRHCCWVTRVRIFKYRAHNKFNYRKPMIEKIIEDKHHVLGKVKKVFCETNGVAVGFVVIMFARHVFCYRNCTAGGSDPAADSSFAIVLDKPMCSSLALLGDDTLLIGTTNGSIYFFSALTGVALQHHYIDIPFHFEILGINPIPGCDSIVLAWDHRSIYRFNLNQLGGGAAPFEMNMGRPMGISGCGGLVCSMQDLGNVWLINTIFRGNMRYFPPPDKISYEEQHTKTMKITKLLTPITYDYQAVWMDRTKMIILYPSGTVRTIKLY